VSRVKNFRKNIFTNGGKLAKFTKLKLVKIQCYMVIRGAPD